MDKLELQPVNETTGIIEHQVQNITTYLEQNGLPAAGIIAPLEQRQIMWKNMQDLLDSVPDEAKKDARYLAKFVVGSGFGLFDYALNSIWNEVVLALHKIVIAYGLDIFFDKAVGTAQRGLYKDEKDLFSIKDRVLLENCKKLELISEITFKKLAHILDMRNDIGISHPTEMQVNAYELLGWVNTCIQEVLLGQPSADAIQVKSLIGNLKEYTQVVDQRWIDMATPKIQALPTRHCDSIIRTFFALYVAPDTDATLLKNISLLAPIVWPLTTDEEKDRLGITLAGYNNNLKKKQHDKGIEFFSLVKGNNHREINDRIVNLDRLASRLKNAHYSYDNYFHEGEIMEEIMTYITTAEDIPPKVASQLTHAIVLARLGRGLSYKGGVSPSAKPYYDKYMEIVGPKFAPLVMIELASPEAQRKMEKTNARSAAIELLTALKKTLINSRQGEAIEYLLQHIPQSPGAIYNKEFKQISSTFIRWS